MSKILRASLMAAAAGSLLMNEEVGAAGGSTAAANAGAGAAGGATEAAKKKDAIRGADQEVKPGMAKTVFHFKKEAIRDAAGNKVADGEKLPSVALLLPLVTAETLLAVLSDPAKSKEQAFLLDQLQTPVYLAARAQINEFREKNKGVEVPLDVLDYSKLTVEALTAAALESGNSSKISDEDWSDWLADYATVMLAHREWTAEGWEQKVEAQKKLLAGPIRRMRDKKLLSAFRQLLNFYAANTTALAEHEECYTNISAYVDKWLNYEANDLLASILG